MIASRLHFSVDVDSFFYQIEKIENGIIKFRSSSHGLSIESIPVLIETSGVPVTKDRD